MNILIFISFFIKNLVNLQKIDKYNLDNGFYCKGKLYNLQKNLQINIFALL